MSWLVTTLTPYVPLAPFGTLLFALLALGVAVWTLGAQKRIARGRATIDFFLKTEMDSSMLKAYDNYILAIHVLGQNPPMNWFRQSVHYRDIRTYLDINELMATAVYKKVFSMRVSYDFWRNILRKIVRESKEVIEDARREEHGQNRYDRIMELNRIWSSWRRLLYCWRW